METVVVLEAVMANKVRVATKTKTCENSENQRQIIPGGGGGGTPQNFGWGCTARFSKPWPYFRPKYMIFHTPFQTWPRKSEINEHVPCQNHTLFQSKKAKTISYFRIKQLENHTLKCGIYQCSLYIGVPPPRFIPPPVLVPPPGANNKVSFSPVFHIYFISRVFSLLFLKYGCTS